MTAAISVAVGWPATTEMCMVPVAEVSVVPTVGRCGSLCMEDLDLRFLPVRSALGLAGANAELTVHPRPERVPEPLPRLLVGAQRETKFLLGVDQQFLVDHWRQDRPGQQVADVVLAAGEDPLLGDVLAGFLDPLAGRAEPGCREVSGAGVHGGVVSGTRFSVRAERVPVAEELRGRGRGGARGPLADRSWRGLVRPDRNGSWQLAAGACVCTQLRSEVRLDECPFQHLDRVGFPDQSLGLVCPVWWLDSPQVYPDTAGLGRLHRDRKASC